jgi:hypothetical protein
MGEHLVTIITVAGAVAGVVAAVFRPEETRAFLRRIAPRGGGTSHGVRRERPTTAGLVFAAAAVATVVSGAVSATVAVLLDHARGDHAAVGLEMVRPSRARTHARSPQLTRARRRDRRRWRTSHRMASTM